MRDPSLTEPALWSRPGSAAEPVAVTVSLMRNDQTLSVYDLTSSAPAEKALLLAAAVPDLQAGDRLTLARSGRVLTVQGQPGQTGGLWSAGVL
jgi:hypothetical protein